MARESRARGEGNARAGVGLSSGWHTPPSSAAKRYITCHDAMRVSVRARDRDMQRGDAHDRVQAQALVRGGMLAGAHPKLAAKPPGSHLGTGSEST